MIQKVELVTFQVAPSDRLSRVRVLLGAPVAKTAFLLVFAFLKSEKLRSYICFRHSSRPNEVLLISLLYHFFYRVPTKTRRMAYITTAALAVKYLHFQIYDME